MGRTLYQATYSNVNERGPDEDQEYQCVQLGDAQLRVKLDSAEAETDLSYRRLGKERAGYRYPET
jgi:hypothetical protein